MESEKKEQDLPARMADGFTKGEESLREERERLLARVAKTLPGSAERKRPILNAMAAVDRAWFVDEPALAYRDAPQPIGEGQTISQPSTVARMLLLAELEEGLDVLEAGAGSGWNASLIAWLSYPGRCVSYEVLPVLARRAAERVARAREHLPPEGRERLSRLEVREGDALAAPDTYDRILVTAGIADEGEELIFSFARAALREGGLLLAPFARGPLLLVRKERGRLVTERTMEEYAFVPLQTGGGL